MGAGMSARAERADEALVAFAAQTMRTKLGTSRAKGRDGWDDPERCPEGRLEGLLAEHAAKSNPGNLADIAIIAMMIAYRRAHGIDTGET